MADGEMKTCAVCGGVFTPGHERTPYEEAGEWLAAELWNDAGTLCPQCLDNRAKLAMMYVIDR
ncbi:hypothetical protein GEOBC_02628 [Geobacteraceae bacterium]|nr:hypothetical protein GEOBC_02628 [Geobacteraceae bacterium]